MTRLGNNQKVERYERTGLLCVDPRAFFELFVVPNSRETERVGNVDVIDISGPLVQRDELWCDSYEAIRNRFTAACEGDAQAILLRIDSPGGDASGCFETARALRAEAAAARKPLYAYIDRACSAAYALASAASAGIAIGETCCAGSIGVLSTREDWSQRNLMSGLRMAFVTSGQRKLDGNPDVPVSEAELAVTQRHVDDLAAKFFKLISDQRPQLSAATIAGFDGGVFYGDAAVESGLADAVVTFDQLLAIASQGEHMTMLAGSEYDTARKALEKVAKGKDANARAARKALAALAEEAAEPEPEEGGDDEPAEEPEEDAADGGEPAAPGAEVPPAATPPAAEGGTAPAAAEGDAAPPAATQAASSSGELSALAEVHKLRAEIAADRELGERNRLLASRPDFAPELKAALQRAPIATVRDMVKTLPKGKVPAKKVAATTTVPATRGTTQGSGVSADRSPEALEMDRRMGLTVSKLGCKREGNSLIFGVISDEVPQPTASKPQPTSTGAA